MVAADPRQAPAASPASQNEVVYVLAASRRLPRIDPTKTVKQVVLSARQLPRFNRFVRRWRRFLSVGYWLGVALGTCTLFLPARIGVWLAIFSMPLQLVPSLASILVMRYDMAVLVARGYEFWYLTLSNLVVSTLISFSFNDARFLVMIGASFAFETALLLDANHRASRLVSVATVLGALTNVAYVACATFGAIEYGRDLELVQYKHRVLYADDATANLIATLVVLLVRNGVRKFNHASDKSTVACITFRCRVALVAENAAIEYRSAVSRRAPSSSSSMSSQSHRTHATLHRRCIPLEYVCDDEKFSPANLLLPRTLQALSMSSGLMRAYAQVLHATSWISLVGWATAALTVDPTIVRAASALALAGSLLVFVSYAALMQRQLLARLFTSFDFIFLSVQLTVSHLCLADIVQWGNPRTLAVLASWLWTHWVLLLDGVLPVHKSERRLHFRTRVAVAVLVLFVAEQLLVSVVIVFLDNTEDPRLDLRDRIVFTLPLRGRTKQLRVVPLLFGRMVATLSWSLRLLWRLWDRADHELLLLQGHVQYENTAPTSMGSAQWFVKRNSVTQVVPTPLAGGVLTPVQPDA